MLQSRHGILLLIFGVDVEHHADFFLRLEILLKLRIDLSHRSFLSDLQILHAVVPHDTAPERIVQIEHQRLFVFAENGLDDIGQIKSKLRNGLHTEGIFVHMPVKRVGPPVQPVGRRHIIDIMNVKTGVLSRILIELLVQSV